MANHFSNAEHREYVYGINPALEIARAGKRPVFRVFADRAAPAGGRAHKTAEFLAGLGAPLDRVEKGRLFDLARSAEHQGIVVETEPYPYAAAESLLEGPRALLLDNVEDPQNLGAMLRSAEVFGWKAVLLPVRGSPGVYPSVVKASAGATEHIAIARDRTANAYARMLVEKGFTLVALDTGGKCRMREIPESERARLALVIGGENAAVGQFILQAAKHVVGIPQRGRITSLNASVAAGIAMLELAECRGG